MKKSTSHMTNRELWTCYTSDTGLQRGEALAEMARRVHRVMITPDVPAIFSQYKLNGGGDQYY